jgi:hypothetical protein
MSPPIQVKKVTEETSSPFVARLFIGLLELREQLYLLGVQGKCRKSMQDHFDDTFKPMFEAAHATRNAAVEARRLVATHLGVPQTQRSKPGEQTGQVLLMPRITTPCASGIPCTPRESRRTRTAGWQEPYRPCPP